jgi:hypothetical protein
MHPRDFVDLALHEPAIGAVVALTWLLVFAPIARAVIRPDGASYLRALPHARGAIIALAAGALVGLQLPWLALWLAGGGARGLVVVAAVTAAALALAAIPTRPPRAGWPRWASAGRALVGVHARALARRGGAVIVRGAGLAVLAGLVGGLFARNNRLVGADAGVLATCVVTIVLVSARPAGLLVLLDAHRASAWLAASTGASARARIVALAAVVVAVDLGYAAIACAAATIAFGTGAWLWAIALPTGAAGGVATVRVLARAEQSNERAVRVVTGAIVVAAGVVAWLATLGVVGVVGIGATALLAAVGGMNIHSASEART